MVTGGSDGVALAVSATRLVKEYVPGSPPALRGVDLEVGRGSFVSIMGPSGSGKSTLLHLLGALDRATQGDVVLNGRSLDSLEDRALTELRRSAIGFVFQSFNLVPVLTAAENVALPAVIDRRKADAYADRLAEVLALVGLTDHAAKLPSQMSGGEQQRVAIARALFLEPPLLLADEPTGNLDSVTGRTVLDLLRRAVDELGTTVVMVTHDAGAAAFADSVVVLKDGLVMGRLELAAGTHEARAAEVHAFLAADGR